MPNSPEIFQLPDWKKITYGYDSLAYNRNAVGQYLPIIFINNNTVNYPNHSSFGIHSYVGTNNPSNSEAINILPSLVGATLCGIDKSNQFGFNWVLMSEEYFNNRNSEMVYLNSPNSSSGNDWWYDLMPNIFFYQLNYLYPGTGDFDHQFGKVADRWYEATQNMNASTTPWRKAFMNYRGWYLSTMTGNSSGVKEPEAAGAIGWLLYNAFVSTGYNKYRIGAEWAMEFLNELNENPSYELQLSYGAYTAARMNAELKTNYDIEKIINWCFDIGSLRGWGTILGKWGNFEVNGLIGEVNGNNDYAFAMNTFQQIGALVPLVRYDERFARAIGKWVLNAANSSRLFYSKYLPDYNEDNWRWSQSNDPNSYIAYEALREERYARSPFGTGDAVEGQWASTNFGLYGSSHVGILGGIIDTTNIPKILKIDLLKADYYHTETYPTFLYYNPYEESKTIIVDLPSGNYDIYETISNNFIKQGVTNSFDLSIDANTARIIVLTPNGGTISYDIQKTLINGKIIDYNSEKIISNYPPRIKALAIEDSIVFTNSIIQIYCTAVDLDGGELSFKWIVDEEVIETDSSIMNWEVPSSEGIYSVKSIVFDEFGESDTTELMINVVKEFIELPIINNIKASPRKIDLSSRSIIECITENTRENLNYNWYATGGIIEGEGSLIEWIAPSREGEYFISCQVTNIEGLSVSDSIQIMVRDFSSHEIGNLIAYYPFSGNTKDESINKLNGTLDGPSFVRDRFGVYNSALQFDGLNDNVSIPNKNILNFSDEISVNFWMYIDEFFDREAYPISHGNWENRWKASITNKKLRWTINTDSGIVDIDSESILELNTWYFVTLQYDGNDLEIFFNGQLDAFTKWSGKLNSTILNLTIGQVTPSNQKYNFSGILDEIRLYDYALSTREIYNFYDINTYISNEIENDLPKDLTLKQNYPNPFNGQTNIKFFVDTNSFVDISIYDVLGRKVLTLLSEEISSGWYNIAWDSKDNNGNIVASGVYIYRLKSDDQIQTKKMLLLQ